MVKSFYIDGFFLFLTFRNYFVLEKAVKRLISITDEFACIDVCKNRNNKNLLKLR